MDAETVITSVESKKRTNIRYIIISLLFVVGAINYADRAIFSIAGPAMMKSIPNSDNKCDSHGLA